MDECISFDKICPDGSQCINTVGSYTCSCAVGYYHFRNETDNTTLCMGIHNYYNNYELPIAGTIIMGFSIKNLISMHTPCMNNIKF